MLHPLELYFPYSIINRIILYVQFYPYLQEYQYVITCNIWDQCIQAEQRYEDNKSALAYWHILPIECRQRIWHKFSMYAIILQNIVGIRFRVRRDVVYLDIIDDDDFEESLDILVELDIDVKYRAVANMIKIGGMWFCII